MRALLSLLLLAGLACSKSTPPKPAEAETAAKEPKLPATPTPPTLPSEAKGPPLMPSADADIPAVLSRLPGTWQTAIKTFDGKTVTQVLTFKADGVYEQDDGGDDGRPLIHNLGTWKVLDGNPATFMLELAIGKTKVASRYRFTKDGALATQVMSNELAYLRKPVDGAGPVAPPLAPAKTQAVNAPPKPAAPTP